MSVKKEKQVLPSKRSRKFQSKRVCHSNQASEFTTSNHVRKFNISEPEFKKESFNGVIHPVFTSSSQFDPIKC